jgi:hypothetical protein
MEVSMPIMTLDELYDAPVPPQEFLIDQLLPACGVIMEIAKPKVGKSTLLRQMIASVLTGEPFLGFTTVKSAVFYFAIEEWDFQVAQHFRDIGLKRGTSLQIQTGLPGPNWLTELRTILTNNPAIKLVVIDPLFLAINVKDANDYAPMMKALAEIAVLAREFVISIVCVHHSKKNMSADAGDNSLGSTALRGIAEGTWQIIKAADGTRTFQTEMRNGKDVPPTLLIFDEESRTSRLGGAEADLERRKAAMIREEVAGQMLDYVGNSPGKTRTEILDNIPYKSSLKSAIFTQLEREGLLVASGAGVKGDPFLYTVALPLESDDPAPEAV